MKEETSLDARYRAEGWGNLAAEAIGIRPQDVESQARFVARHASNLLSSVTLERDQWREACLAHGEKARAAEAERDQLRAKLAEYEHWHSDAEKEVDSMFATLGGIVLDAECKTADKDQILELLNGITNDVQTALTAAHARGKAEGVREEREVCAKIAETFPVGMHGNLAYAPREAAEQACEEIAAAIRSRTGGEHE